MTKILIVDDATFTRRMIKDILTSNGFEVVGEAKNGIKAVEMYKMLKPDVVTMDIEMREMDGIETVKAIMQINPSAKIIMCSAFGHEDMVIDAIKAGAIDFVVKPFKTERVIEAINKVIKADCKIGQISTDNETIL